MHVHDNLVTEQPPTSEVPNEPTTSKKQLSSSSSDSDDSVEDENYKIDPTEAIDDEEIDEMELVDEFCRKRRKYRRDSSQRARDSANVDASGENATVLQSAHQETTNAHQETANANDDILNSEDGVSDDSIEALGSEVEGSLSSDDEKLRTVRQQNKDILIASKGRIARNSGARLEGDNEGPSIIGGGVVMPPRVHTNNDPTNPLQEASNAPPHSTNVHHQPTNVGVPPSSGSTHVGKDKWPSLLTTYEGGYQSDQSDSDDEAPLEHSDDEATMHRRKRKNKVKYAYFNEDVDMKAVELTSGLRFNSRKVLKEAILNYSLQKHYDLVYMKNDKVRINVGCSMCRWELNAGQDLEDDDAWQIKSVSRSHTCSRTFKNRLVTESWLANNYLDKVLRNPKFKPKDIQGDMIENHQVNVCLRKCQRAKEMALNAVDGLLRKQYGLLKPYVRELCRSNMGSTCILKVTDESSSQPGTFQRVYICFAALKMGFMNYCRPIFGLDGCFLKHACGGQLLCAVGRDGNNQMWPIAWAIVDGGN